MTNDSSDKRKAGGYGRLSEWSHLLADNQFDEKTARLAARIAVWFPERRTRLGLWGANSVEYLSALVAILRSGHSAMPLDPRLSSRELSEVAERAGLAGLLVDRDFPRLYRSALTPLPCYPLAARGDEDDGDAPVRTRELAEGDVAVLMCSSGSTGLPKIVPLTLRSILQHARAVCAHLSVTWRDSWIACLPFSHIGGLAIPFRCLVSGASLLISRSADPEELNRLIELEEATLISVVPTVLERMLSVRGGQPFPLSLRMIMVGGGPVPERLLARSGIAIPTYGLTEAGSTVTCARPGCDESERASAGLPLPGMQIKITDPKGKSVARGDIGEIVVRGPGAATTYVGNSEASAATFVSGWIKTGDRGRLDAHGFLHVEGRRGEDILISGGENVSPAEIEAALRLHPRVTAAVVMPVDSEEWGQSPAAFLVLAPGRPLKKIHIYQFLEDKLARFKFPKTVVFAETLPQLSNGKPDLKTIRKILEGQSLS
ncbi:MAG: class I adenylate-forming enzyme family protein [bacterium]|nr:class I adenylate-forming enzyme family protein [bacterium]